MQQPGVVTVEFYGIPRQRAGRAELQIRAGTISELLQTIQEFCPGLADLVGPDGRLARHYLLSMDDTGFLKDERRPLKPGDRLLLLSADAGG